MEIGNDFKLRDDLQNYDTLPVEILTGPYKGVIMRYTEVSVQEQEDDTAKLKFGFEFIENAGFKEDILKTDSKFLTQAGLILNAMILESLGDNDAIGENYSEESVEQRAVRS